MTNNQRTRVPASANSRARIVIDVDVRRPSARERHDLGTIVSVEAPTFVHDVFGVVVSDDYTLIASRIDWPTEQEQS